MTYLAQQSFALGQVSRAALGNTESNLYRNGVLKLHDAIVTRHGTVKKRYGSEYIGSTLNNKPARLTPFRVQGRGDYMCEHTEGFLRVWNGGSLVEFSAGVTALASPYTEAEIFSLQYAQSEDTLFLVSEGREPQTLKLDNSGWTFEEIDYTTPPSIENGTDRERLVTTEFISGQATDTPAKFRIHMNENHFQNNDIGHIYRVGDRWYKITGIESQDTALADQAFVHPYLSINPNLEYTLETADWDGPWVSSEDGPGLLYGAAIAMEPTQIRTDGGVSWFAADPSGGKSGHGILIDLDPDELSSPFPDFVYLQTIYSGSEASAVPITGIDVSIESNRCRVYRMQRRDPGATTTFLATEHAAINPVQIYTDEPYFTADSVGTEIQILGGVIVITEYRSPYEALYTTVTDMQVEADGAPGFLEPYPTCLVSGSISLDTGFPRAVAFHADRLFFGGFSKYPNRVLSSRTGKHRDWSQSANDGSGLSFDITSDNSNRVAWMQTSGSVLMVGTDTGEYALTGLPLTATNLSVELQTSFGGAAVQPHHIGEGPTYVSRCGCAIRQSIYDDVKHLYLSNELTYSADDMFDSSRIRELHHAVEPNAVVYAVMDNGSVCAMSRRPENGVNAWSSWSIPATSVSILPGDNRDEAWFATNRDGTYQIERLTEDRHLDASVLATAAGNNLTGLSHLADKTVQVLADGEYIGDYLVDSGGAINLGMLARQNTYVGLGYTAEVQPIFLEYTDALGMTPGRNKQVSNIYVHLHDTRSGKCNGDNFQPTGDGIGNQWLEVPGQAMNSPLPVVRITAEEPYPFHLLAVAADLKVTGVSGKAAN